MSAESCTSPGGYGSRGPGSSDGEQFPVHDKRTVAEIADWLQGGGFQVSFSD
jgi:hypothetical protein